MGIGLRPAGWQLSDGGGKPGKAEKSQGVTYKIYHLAAVLRLDCGEGGR